MSLNHQHQMGILQDILKNHLDDCCGTISECEQMERLVKSLLLNEEIDLNTKHMLEEIYFYSQKGKYSPDLDDHITSQQETIGNWVGQFDNLT